MAATTDESPATEDEAIDLTTDSETPDTEATEDSEASAPEGEVTAEDTDDSEAKPTGRGQRRILIALAALTALVVLAGVGILGWQFWQTKQVEWAREDAQRAAVSYAQILTSIDSNKVDENFAQVLDGATGEFKDMYSQSSVTLRQLLIDNKATAHGVVVESAVQSASKNQVVVLLFVDQSVQNSSAPDPRIDRSRIKMTMDKVDGRWRASKVELP